MRPRIVALDVDALEWQPLGPPGLYTKLLSRDPQSGARTALQRLCPQDGYVAPTVAHFHTTYEEIVGISGCFTFDHATWIRPGAYVFHPPRTVHGFSSGVKEESTFLSRVGRDLDVNLVQDPAERDLYVIEGPVPERRPVAYGDAPGAVGFTPSALLGAGVEACVVSVDPATGEGTAFVGLPAGWASRTTPLTSYFELFVLDGGIGVDGAAVAARRDYFFYPPGTPIDALRTDRPTLAYVNFGGDIGL